MAAPGMPHRKVRREVVAGRLGPDGRRGVFEHSTAEIARVGRQHGRRWAVAAAGNAVASDAMPAIQAALLPHSIAGHRSSRRTQQLDPQGRCGADGGTAFSHSRQNACSTWDFRLIWGAEQFLQRADDGLGLGWRYALGIATLGIQPKRRRLRATGKKRAEKEQYPRKGCEERNLTQRRRGEEARNWLRREGATNTPGPLAGFALSPLRENPCRIASL